MAGGRAFKSNVRERREAERRMKALEKRQKKEEKRKKESEPAAGTPSSPLATWVRRPENFVPYLRVPRLSTRGSGRASARRSGGWRGWRTGSGLGLFLALLFFLLPLLERLHATLRFATLTDVALEGPSPCHGDHLRAPALLDANVCDPNPRSRPASRHRPALALRVGVVSSSSSSAGTNWNLPVKRFSTKSWPAEYIPPCTRAATTRQRPSSSTARTLIL